MALRLDSSRLAFLLSFIGCAAMTSITSSAQQTGNSAAIAPKLSHGYKNLKNSSRFSFPMILKMFESGQDVSLDQVQGSYTGVGYHFHRPYLAISSALFIGRLPAAPAGLSSGSTEPTGGTALGEPKVIEASLNNANEFELDEYLARAEMEETLLNDKASCYQAAQEFPLEVKSVTDAPCWDSSTNSSYRAFPFRFKIRSYKHYLVGLVFSEYDGEVEFRGAGTYVAQQGQIVSAFVYVLPLLY